MKKFKIYVLAAFVCMCALFAACDDNIPGVAEFESIQLTDLTLDPSLYQGFEMEVRSTRNIAGKVVLTPVDATDRAENFYSSDPTIATVAGNGDITANAVGNCEITIAVGEFSVKFPLRVIPFVPIHIVDMALSMSKVTMTLEGASSTFDMNSVIVLTPLNANDELEFEVTGTAGIVNVSAQGVISSIAMGVTSVTVTSKYDPTKTKTLTVEVVDVITGNYDRTGWVMTTSQNPLPNITDCGQGIAAALDNDPNTNLALVRPGKNTGGVTLTTADNVWFTIDMGKVQFVNSFEIAHRTGGNVVQTRWWGFDQILGSNDGEEFTLIASNVLLPADVSETGIPNHNVKFTGGSYRYFKFYAQTVQCFYQNSYTSAGLTVQMQEFYLGVQ